MHRRTTPARAVLAVTTAAALLVGVLALDGSGRAVSASPHHTRPGGTPTPGPTEGPPSATRPNIVIILTDDQRVGTESSMPHVASLLQAQGTTFSRAMVPTSLCCPSRSTILTGRYAHTTRLFGNGDVGGPKYGGWPRFHQLGLENLTMAPALQAVGYRTGLIGKYLNFYGTYAPYFYKPPGWDTFATFMSSHGSYFNYRLSDGSSYGMLPQDYSTDVLAARATDFISTTPLDKPLFLYFATFGPHAPYTPAPRDAGTLATLAPYTSPTLEQPLNEMPHWMAARAHYSQSEVDVIRQHQLEDLKSIDETVGSIDAALRATGREQDTLFIFMSDNGYFWGEHRIVGKDSPYDLSTRIPMVLRWDGHVPAGVTSNRLVLNVDVASTVSTAAGARMRTDGLDMLGSKTRGGFVLEAMNGYNNRPAYCGWRTQNRMYVRWATGEVELYDYRRDPDEQRNLAHLPAWATVRKAMKAKAMAACSPVPPHFSWTKRQP